MTSGGPGTSEARVEAPADAAREFWARQLALTPGPDLRPHWRSLPVAPDERHEARVTFDAPAAARLRALARDTDLGLLVVILGGLAHVIQRYTGAEVVRLDTPPLRADDGGPAPLAARVPLLARVDPSASLRAHLEALRRTVADSYTHQDFQPRDAGQASAAAVGVVSAALHGALPDACALRVEIERQPEIALRLRSGPGFAPRAFLDTFARQLRHVLSQLDDLDAPLRALSLIDAGERARHLDAHSTSRPDLDRAQSIGEAFRERAAAAPEHVALRLGQRRLTYGELATLSNRLARFLAHELNVQPGDVVGVVIDRTPEVIVALLAVLQAGAVYLPLDAEYPAERIRFLVDDARVRALLLDSRHLAAFAGFYATPMFALDLQLAQLEADDAPLERALAPDAPAYVIYTSGSTGRPKGVVLGQRGFLNMIRHHAEAFGVHPGDRLAQFYALSFDSSMFEVFMALLNGATLVLVPKDAIGDPRAFIEYASAQGVTFLTVPPVYLATLAQDALPDLRVVVSAGDNARLADALGRARRLDWYNSYGPTETSVCASHHRVDARRGYGTRVPIGRPISNTWIYVLDEQLELAPEGLPGQLAIAGLGLAQGYLQRDELTRAAFVPHPFAPGERLYLTGDLGLRLPDGEIELIGRADTQVKVRGYRIELGEIESALRLHAAVAEVAVLAREDEPGERRLVAYVATCTPAGVQELRQHLAARLPAYMLPAVWVFLETLPVTANGKIDRQALPAPQEAATPVAGTPSDAPRTPLEERLCRVWGEVLGLSRVGIHDSFFELGGDSILLIQAVWRANQEGIRILPKQVFDLETIAALAAVAGEAEAPAAERGPLTGPLPLGPSQHWFFSEPRADAAHYNQAVVLEVPADIDAARLAACAARLEEQHDALRLRFRRDAGGWRQECAAPTGEAPFREIDLAQTAPEARERAFLEAAATLQSSLDLEHGPLWRLALVRFGAHEAARVFVCVHHLAIDGVSWGILLGDLHAAYHQPGGAPPARGTSLRDWNERLARYASEIDGERGYWLGAAGAPGPLPRDHDAPPDANDVGRSATCRDALDAGATQALLHEAPRAARTQVVELLLASLALTLREWTGGARHLLALEGHGREDLFPGCDVSRTLGWFTSVYPLALELPAPADPDEALRRVKEQLRAVPRQGLGYGVLRYLGPDAELRARLAAQPQPELLFNYLGQSDRILGAQADWRPLLDLDTRERSPRAARTHLFEIEAVVAGGCLRLAWTYATAFHAPATVERLCRRQREILADLVARCTRAVDEHLTPADFPSAGLSQADLDALLRQVRG